MVNINIDAFLFCGWEPHYAELKGKTEEEKESILEKLFIERKEKILKKFKTIREYKDWKIRNYPRTFKKAPKQN